MSEMFFDQLELSQPDYYLGYLELIHLMENSVVVITDFGGIQEESTYLRFPCLTIYSMTESPIIIELRTNVLIPTLDTDIIFEKSE
ncbi:MAG: UDP-N-acetylglucosamine 2-epimerase [Saprospiraceae bacterium]